MTTFGRAEFKFGLNCKCQIQTNFNYSRQYPFAGQNVDNFSTQLNLPEELKEFDTFQQTLLNYNPTNQKDDEIVLSFIQSHPLLSQYEYYVCIILRPKKVFDYAQLFIKFPQWFRLLYMSNFQISQRMANFLESNNHITL